VTDPVMAPTGRAPVPLYFSSPRELERHDGRPGPGAKLPDEINQADGC
jgi:hypothetical protein